jgi:CHAD domain-containing protein
MAEGKWISDLTQATPVATAARRCLKDRLKGVRDHLDLALREPEKDVEHVPQLRVATRRAAAAIDIFESCLSRKAYGRVQRQLRRLRRAAGAARDWDVFTLTLAAPSQRLHDSPGLDFLVGYALGQRYAAQQSLEVVGEDLAADFDKFVDEALDAIREPASRRGPRTLVDLARPMLAGLLSELDEAGQQDMNNYEHLHQVRIVGKRLRYAMEVFVGCFPSAFKEMLYPAVEQMQEILGLANDSQVAGRRLAELRVRTRAAWPADWKRFQPAIERLLRYHQRRLPQERRRFIAWWQHWHKSETRAMFCMLVQTPFLEA